jgi:hypothetical protein
LRDLVAGEAAGLEVQALMDRGLQKEGDFEYRLGATSGK